MFEHAGQPAGATTRAKGFRRRMTSSEQRLWRELRKLDLNFRRQAPVGRYVTDFACHGRRLVIEVDGGVHERLAEVAARDVERQAWLEAEGYRVLRFTDRQVHNDVAAVLREVEQALALPLDGGGLGGGVAAELTEAREWAPAPNGDLHPIAAATPPSPTLPPSRGKGGSLPSYGRKGE
ncbi:MAG: endonuclease domain-containing protein [Phenylobacterium sp.]